MESLGCYLEERDEWHASVEVTGVEDLEVLLRGRMMAREAAAYAPLERWASSTVHWHHDKAALEAAELLARHDLERQEVTEWATSNSGGSEEVEGVPPPPWVALLLGAERFYRHGLLRQLNEDVRSTSRWFSNELEAFEQMARQPLLADEERSRAAIWMGYRWQRHFFAWEESNRAALMLHEWVNREDAERMCLATTLLRSAASASRSMALQMTHEATIVAEVILAEREGLSSSARRSGPQSRHPVFNVPSRNGVDAACRFRGARVAAAWLVVRESGVERRGSGAIH
jgi:hypothetical protein